MSDPAPDRPAGEPGRSLPREIAGFELIAKIGQGGMGAVFKARQRSMDREVALKVLSPQIARNPKFIDRFVREARASARISHPNIVQGIDVGQDPVSKLWYFAMELIEGPTLKQVLAKEGPLDERRALGLARDVALGLVEAARQGIVHRDIKPDNILIAASGATKLADLGLAKQEQDDAELTQAGQSLGTPLYMAPEQVRGQTDRIDARTDLYALGATLFHLLTGKPPFRGETSAVVMAKHLSDPPPRADEIDPRISPATGRLIQRLMAKEREERPATAALLVAEIDAVLSGESPSGAGRVRAAKPAARARPAREASPAAPAPAGLPAWLRPGPRLALIAGGVVGALAAVVLLATRGEPPPPAEPPGAAPTANPTVAETPARRAPAPDPALALPAPAPAPVAAPAETPAPSGDVRQMLAYVQEWEKKHPQAYAEALQRYAKVAKQAEGTPLEIEMQDLVGAAVQAVRERQRAAADAAWQPLAKRAQELAAAGDFDGAIAAAVPPAEFADSLRPVAGEVVRSLRLAAQARLDPAIATAEACSKRAEPAEGLAVLDAIAGLKYAPYATRLGRLRARLESERGDTLALHAKRTQVAADPRWQEHLKRFDEALLGKGDAAAAQAVAAAAVADPALAGQGPRTQALAEVAAAAAAESRRQVGALGAVVGKPFPGKDGGTIVAAANGVLSVEMRFAGGSAVKKVKFADLDEPTRRALVAGGAAAPATPAAKVAEAALRLGGEGADLVAIEALLAEAGEHPLVAHYRAAVQERRVSQGEAAAAAEWAALAKSSPTRPDDGRALAGRIEAWKAKHGGTAFATAQRDAVAALAEKAAKAQVVELLTNGGFEQGAAGWRFGSRWRLLVELPRSGGTCLALPSYYPSSARQTVSGLVPGTTYVFSGFVRWQNGGYDGLELSVDATSADTPETAVSRSGAATGWMPFKLVFTASRAQHTVTVARGYGSDCVLDDLSLVQQMPGAAAPGTPPPKRDDD